MRLDVYHHVDCPPETTGQLAQIITLLTAMLAKETQIMAIDQATQAVIDTLNSNVAQQTTIEASTEALLNGLSAQLAAAASAAGASPEVIAAIKSASDAIAANNAKTAAALVANTPVA